MPTSFTFTSRELVGAASVAPYAAANLGDHVGDDPLVVEGNRDALARHVGVHRAQLVFMQQVHGAEVALVNGPVATPVPGVDALVTATRGLALVVLVADCIPVLLADGEAGVVAAVHAGRRGVALDVVSQAVRTMRSLGARTIKAGLGPHIGACCYEVGADIQAEVATVLPMARAQTSAGTPSLDLAAAVAEQLRAADVTDVVVSQVCTAEAAGLFSYRRDGVTGRFAGVVHLS